jgi:hypothetical protein
MEGRHHTHWMAVIAFFVTFTLFVDTVGPNARVETISEAKIEPAVVIPIIEEQVAVALIPERTHLATPDSVRAIYLTGWSAGTPKRLTKALELFEDSVLNAVVIDIKDATGKLSYMPLDPALVATGAGTKRISNLKGVIDEFHKRGIYVIGRLTVFQDPLYATLYPSETFLDTRTGLPWTDNKGIKWLRPDSSMTREYASAIARDAYAQGFDEINLDYVRFPSDGPLQYLDLSGFAKNKSDTMQDFFVAINEDLEGIPLSADVFGLTMSANDDVGIGQKAVMIAPSVDALAPMVYPSHFWNGTYGIPVPAEEPYKVIYKSLSDGIKKLETAGIDKSKIRPWLQDFDLLGVEYTAELVRAQIQAVYDLGIDSWMMWDPRNEYTEEVYKMEEVEGLGDQM